MRPKQHRCSSCHWQIAPHNTNGLCVTCRAALQTASKIAQSYRRCSTTTCRARIAESNSNGLCTACREKQHRRHEAFITKARVLGRAQYAARVKQQVKP